MFNFFASPQSSSVHGISQARILEWVAISFSRGSSQPRAEPMSPVSAGGFFTTEAPGKPINNETHSSKVMLKILQARLQQYMNRELLDVQAEFIPSEEPEIKLPASTGSSKKQESSRKTSISASLTMPKPLTVWIITNYGKFLEVRISDYLTCLLRNLYAGQEAIVRIEDRKT